MHVSEKEISAYLDNSMLAEKQKRVKEHISGCENCRRKLHEWESLFDTIGMLSFDFSLEGLEEKVLQRIRKGERETVPPRILVSYMVYVMVLLFIAGLSISPMVNQAGQVLQAAGNFITGAGIDFINEFKWHAIDIVSFIQDAELSSWVFFLVAGIILIAGGTYFSFGSRLRRA